MDKCSTSIVSLIKQASVSFQKAGVVQQLAIEAMRAELRLSKLFASQLRTCVKRGRCKMVKGSQG